MSTSGVSLGVSRTAKEAMNCKASALGGVLGGNIVGGIKLDKLSDYISSIVNESRETNLNQ